MPIRIKGIDTPELRGKCLSEKEAARAANNSVLPSTMAAKKYLGASWNGAVNCPGESA
tara:strand:+ start:505 stop:678 length:174 start_codon:yes stop_codon:yes gene_type:complete